MPSMLSYDTINVKQISMAKKIKKEDITCSIGINTPKYSEKQVKKFIIDAFLEGAVLGEMFNNENRCFHADALDYYSEFLNEEI